jgi:hypothetical protein
MNELIHVETHSSRLAMETPANKLVGIFKCFVLLVFCSAPIAADLSEDFESYETGLAQKVSGKFWRHSGGGSVKIVDKAPSLDQQALQAWSKSCYAAVAHVKLPRTKFFDLEFDLVFGERSSEKKCRNLPAVFAKLSKGPNWQSPDKQLLAIDYDGAIRSSNSAETVLSRVGVGEKLTVRIRYRPSDEFDGTVIYWINGEQKGKASIAADRHESKYNYLELSSRRGTIWVDNIRLINLGDKKPITEMDRFQETFEFSLYSVTSGGPVTSEEELRELQQTVREQLGHQHLTDFGLSRMKVNEAVEKEIEARGLKLY